MFTGQELNSLIEAVDAWVDKDLGADIMGAVFEGMAVDRGNPEAALRAKQQADAARAKRDQERKIRKERAILLQAKLIQMRDSQAADKLLEDSSK